MNSEAAKKDLREVVQEILDKEATPLEIDLITDNLVAMVIRELAVEDNLPIVAKKALVQVRRKKHKPLTFRRF